MRSRDILMVGAAVLLATAPAAVASVDLQKKAKEAGIAVQNCMHCHGEKLPRKGASTLNDRGKWLLAEKEKRQSKDVDVSWLKDYKEKEPKK